MKSEVESTRNDVILKTLELAADILPIVFQNKEVLILQVLAIEGKPSTYSAIGKKAGIGLGAALHHNLEKLKREGLIYKVVNGKSSKFELTPAGMIATEGLLILLERVTKRIKQGIPYLKTGYAPAVLEQLQEALSFIKDKRQQISMEIRKDLVSKASSYVIKELEVGRT